MCKVIGLVRVSISFVYVFSLTIVKLLTIIRHGDSMNHMELQSHRSKVKVKSGICELLQGQMNVTCNVEVAHNKCPCNMYSLLGNFHQYHPRN